MTAFSFHYHLRIVNNLACDLEIVSRDKILVTNLAQGEVAIAKISHQPKLVVKSNGMPIYTAHPDLYPECESYILVINSDSIITIPQPLQSEICLGRSSVRFVNCDSACPVSFTIKKQEKNLDPEMETQVEVDFEDPEKEIKHTLLGMVTVLAMCDDMTQPAESQPYFMYSGQVLTVLLLKNRDFVFVEDKRGKQDVTVSEWKPESYMGHWYQVASIPQFFSKGCTFSTATYTLVDKRMGPRVKVLNICYDAQDQEINRACGWAVPVKPGILRVGFPGSPGYIPSVYPNYIIHSTDYISYSMVGSPDRSNLYILSRTPSIPVDLYFELVDTAKKLGYQTDRLKVDVEV